MPLTLGDCERTMFWFPGTGDSLSLDWTDLRSILALHHGPWRLLIVEEGTKC